MSHTEHERAAAGHPGGRGVGCAVLTVSDTRTRETDGSGDAIEAMLLEAGHGVVERRIVPDEPGLIEAALLEWQGQGAIEVVICTGGTGVGRRDTTSDVVRRLLRVELDGFGELFRVLSFEQVGAAAMLSRAVGGLAGREGSDGTFIFALPGSTGAVRLGMEKLIVPQLPHLVWERKRS